MVLYTIKLYYSNNWVKVNNQLFIIYNIIASFFWLVNQESDLDHCLNSKSQITAIFTVTDISTDVFYVALNTSSLGYLTFNEQLQYHKKQLKKFNNE